MILVGLTGGIGSGKSTVSAALAERGAVIVDADAVVRRSGLVDLTVTSVGAEYLTTPTVLIVGHLLAPAILIVYMTWRPDPVILASGFAIGCIALSLYLLPRLKGMIVAFQWSKRMHGFGGE